MPMNRADKNVKIYACRNATNSSSKLNAVAPRIVAGATPQIKGLVHAAAINATRTANTRCPASMFASKRTAKKTY